MGDIARLVRRYREERGWGVRELARRAGLTHPVISNIERGKTRFPDSETIKRLALAFECPEQVFMDALSLEAPPCEFDAEEEAAIEAEAEQRWAEQSIYGDFTPAQKEVIMGHYRTAIRARNERLRRERQCAEERPPYSAAG